MTCTLTDRFYRAMLC